MTRWIVMSWPVASATERLAKYDAVQQPVQDLNQVFRIGFEFAWRETDYADAGVPDNEGASFHITQFQWALTNAVCSGHLAVDHIITEDDRPIHQ